MRYHGGICRIKRPQIGNYINLEKNGYGISKIHFYDKNNEHNFELLTAEVTNEIISNWKKYFILIFK